MSITLLWLIGAPILALFAIWSIVRDWRWKRGEYARALVWRQEDLDRWRVQQEERLSQAWMKVREQRNELEHFRTSLARRESAVRDAESDFNIRRLDVTPPPMPPMIPPPYAPPSQPFAQHPFLRGEEPTMPPYMRYLTPPPSGAVPPLGPNARPDDAPTGMGETDSELNEAFGYLAPPRYGRVTQPIRSFRTQESVEFTVRSIHDYLGMHTVGHLGPELAAQEEQQQRPDDGEGEQQA